MLKKLLLPFDAFKELAAYCRKVGIEFLSTPFDLESIDLLEEIGCRLWKIPSGEITNLPYLERLAKTGKPIIMSTGMCTLEEVEAAVNVLKENRAGDARFQANIPHSEWKKPCASTPRVRDLLYDPALPSFDPE